MLEGYGITTVCLSISRRWSSKLPGPRNVFVRFPYGASCGEVEMADQQRAVLKGLIRHGLAIQRPGETVSLPFRWRREVYPPQDLSDLEPCLVEAEPTA